MNRKLWIGIIVLFFLSGAGVFYFWDELPMKDFVAKIIFADDPTKQKENFSIPKKLGREPAGKAKENSSNKMANIDSGEWKKEPALNGEYPKRITNFNLRTDIAQTNIWQASMEFLESYGHDLYKLNLSQWKVEQLMPGKSDNDLRKIVYEQEINGVPVLNSRLAFYYSNDGSLLEVQANIAAESFDVNSGMSPTEAATFAHNAITQHYSQAGVVVPDSLAVNRLAENAKYAVYLSDAGEPQPVYQFLVGMPGLTGGEAGEREIIVDAYNRQVAIDRKLTRN